MGERIQSGENGPVGRVKMSGCGARLFQQALVTDVVCLKQAKSLGKQVEIVDEEDLDKLRCAVTDIECLQKAKRLGKQVEIID